MAVYYVDFQHGLDANDALTPEHPGLHEGLLPVKPGDTVLFRRGGFTRRNLCAVCGDVDMPVTYGAYGIGDKPVFCASCDISGPACWEQEREGLWRYAGNLTGEPCNLIFNEGSHCGNLRRSLSELTVQGEWTSSQLGYSNDPPKDISAAASRFLYIHSAINPGEYFTHIECAVFCRRQIEGGNRWVIFEDLSFEGSGVHGYQAAHAHGVILRRCDFRFIGGAVWRRTSNIRFGNAIEFWDGAEDILVEDCFFDNIYDSAITHQGGPECTPAKNVTFRRNTIRNFGMAAYEVRDRIPVNARFEDNDCAMAGGGFAMQGLPAPRDSEIHPEPMGHHVFIWRIEGPTYNGSLTIRNNLFDGAPYGSAVYSRISRSAEGQIFLDKNKCRSIANEPYYSREGGLSY